MYFHQQYMQVSIMIMINNKACYITTWLFFSLTKPKCLFAPTLW